MTWAETHQLASRDLSNDTHVPYGGCLGHQFMHLKLTQKQAQVGQLIIAAYEGV